LARQGNRFFATFQGMALGPVKVFVSPNMFKSAGQRFGLEQNTMQFFSFAKL